MRSTDWAIEEYHWFNFQIWKPVKRKKQRRRTFAKQMRNASAHRKPNKGRNEGSSRNEAKLEKLSVKDNSSSPRSISITQLNTLLCLHPWPIKLVVYERPYSFEMMGYLILRCTSRLDAFSVYHIRTRLPGYALGRTTDAPEVRPTRSSRTKVSSSQISNAHDR